MIKHFVAYLVAFVFLTVTRGYAMHLYYIVLSVCMQ